MDKHGRELLIKRHCPYKFQHFCDGTPNLSVFEASDRVVAKPPCRLRFKCPVRARYREEVNSND